MNIIEKKVDLSLCENPVELNYDEVPELMAQDFALRTEKLFSMPKAQEYDAFVVYADREHFSNVHYFTGYDPRWEESLLILKKGNKPVLLVGNEGMGYVGSVVADIEVEMFQTLSLVGQPNDSRSKKLTDIFQDHGIEKGMKIGLIGWKMYKEELFDLDVPVTDVPFYMVQTLAAVCGMENIRNATDLMLDCEYGLKHTVSAKEIVQFDAVGTKVSRGVYNFFKKIRPGMREVEAAQLLELNGEPLNMHPNINFGDAHVAVGLNSPKYDVKLEYGMPLGVGYGMRGSLVHKCGMYIRNEEDLQEENKNYIEDLLKPYFACVVRWYEMMKVGTTGGQIYDMVEEMLGMEKFGIGLNPGHLENTDEWTNSPIFKGSTLKLHSGMVFQCDYTVSFKEPFMSAHVEDGLVLADQALMEEVRSISPSCYERIMARKKFIREVLNVDLPEEVMPLSDLTLICYPYMADTSVVLAKEM